MGKWENGKNQSPIIAVYHPFNQITAKISLISGFNFNSIYYQVLLGSELIDIEN